MTVSELQTYRTALLANLTGSPVKAYGVNGRNISRMSMKEIREEIAWCDMEIARASTGMFAASQFRKPE